MSLDWTCRYPSNRSPVFARYMVASSQPLAVQAGINALKKGGNKNYKIVELPELNHLFQKSNTGAPSEYTSIEETINPEALKLMSDWILKEVVK